MDTEQTAPKQSEQGLILFASMKKSSGTYMLFNICRRYIAYIANDMDRDQTALLGAV